MGKEKKRDIVVIPKTWIREIGVFNFNKLYSSICSWFAKNNYIFMEKAHQRIIKPEGDEIKGEWFAYRKIDGYVKFKFQVIYEMYRYNEVKIDDKIYAKANFNFNIYVFYTKDYQNTFKGPFGEFLREIYEKYLIKNRLLDFEGKLWAEGQDFINTMKDALEHYKR